MHIALGFNYRYTTQYFTLMYGFSGTGSVIAAGNYTGADYYNEARQQREEIFDEIFWNETSGIWRDFDITTNQHLDGIYLSSVAPLVWECGPSNTTRQLSTLKYLKVSQ